MSDIQPTRPKRIEFIDLLRGWAVLVMIETHVMNGTLLPELRASEVFSWVTFLNGLVAPSFTFAAGLAYAVTTRRKINDYLSFGKPLLLNVRRLLFVIMIGYLLHIPRFHFQQLLHETSREEWEAFFQADILQCIGVSLLIVQALLLLLRTERRLYASLLLCSCAIVFLSPLVWATDWRQILPLPVAGYMNGTYAANYSGFPLFPWSAFIFAGAVVGYHYVEARQRGEETRFFKNIFWIAVALVALSFPLESIISRLYASHDVARTSPAFFFLRLGIVLLLCAVLFFYERRRSVSPRSIITLVGRESLIVYAVHLFLIYGNIGTFNFAKTVHHSFGYVEASITTLVLVGAMIVLAFLWSRVRLMHPRVKWTIHWLVTAGFVLVFFFGPKA